jgi:hypothetical protein
MVRLISEEGAIVDRFSEMSQQDHCATKCIGREGDDVVAKMKPTVAVE